MKILVTGGAGFIGSHVVDEYIRQGEDVAVVDNLSSGMEKNIHSDAKFYKLDIESSEIEEVIKYFKPDVVNHHAAQIDVRRSVTDPFFDARINIIGTINILQNCVKYKTKKVIFASTGGAIYGEQESFPAVENHPLKPISPYGVAKLSAEKYLFYYKWNYGLEHVILRYSNVYGPRQDPHGEAGVVAIFIKKLLNGEQPIINGDGKQTRDFVYVSDVVNANILALRTPESGIFNIATSIETDINTIFDMLVKILESNIKKVHGPAKLGEQRRSILGYRQAKSILGWKPDVPLENGLRQTVKYFKTEFHR